MIEDFNRKLEEKSGIVVIAGRRGAGKTALGFRILENIASKKVRPVYALLFPGILPAWINRITSMMDAPNGSVVLIDETSLEFRAKSLNTRKNNRILELFAIARHKDLSLFFITQHTTTVDICIIRQADTLILKEPSLIQEKTERSELRDLVEAAKESFGKLPKGERELYAYVVDDEYVGLIQNALPTFWSQVISKAYSGLGTSQEIITRNEEKEMARIGVSKSH